jgi:hypothetical protein
VIEVQKQNKPAPRARRGVQHFTAPAGKTNYPSGAGADQVCPRRSEEQRKKNSITKHYLYNNRKKKKIIITRNQLSATVEC